MQNTRSYRPPLELKYTPAGLPAIAYRFSLAPSVWWQIEVQSHILDLTNWLRATMVANHCKPHQELFMGRWRPPPPRSSPYITPTGFEALQAELKALWLRRRDVVKALSEAAAEGDRSENAEYIYRKKELAGIDRRIRYLQKRLPALTVVREKPASSTVVYFGATVELCDESGDSVEYRIVGPDETDARKNDISVDSPMAKALLKKTVDDEVIIDLGETRRTVVVTGIHYDD